MKKASYNRLYGFIEDFAKKNNLRNTLIALRVAEEYHSSQIRDDGEPYIMHPMRVCTTLILLRPEEAFRKTYPRKNEKLIWQQCDILYATALLHDVIEDVDRFKNGKYLCTVYYLDFKVLKNTRILTKPPKTKEYFWSRVYKPKDYYKNIQSSLIASIIKLADRKDNCKTMSIYSLKRKEKYIKENYEYIYPLGEQIKKKYPEFERIVNNLVGIIKESVKPYEK